MKKTLKDRMLHEESGFTLIEVLVTVMVMIMVFFALYNIFDMSVRVFSFGNDKVEATENARLGIEKMEREIRAAYPVDRLSGRQHIFFTSGSLATPTRPGEQSITFGNDLSSGGIPPNRMVDPGEEITYELRLRSNLNDACPSSGTGGICTLVRRQSSSADFQPVVEYVVPNGLAFTYLRSNLGATDATGNGTDIGVVRIKLQVSVDGRRQTLTTDVDLRNRG